MQHLKKRFQEWFTAEHTRVLKPGDNWNGVQLVGAAPEGGDLSESKDAVAESESKAAVGEDAYATVTIPHATKLRVAVRKESRLPHVKSVFVWPGSGKPPANGGRLLLRSLGAAPVTVDSLHPYNNNTDEYKTVVCPGAKQLKIWFDEQSSTENGEVAKGCLGLLGFVLLGGFLTASSLFLQVVITLNCSKTSPTRRGGAKTSTAVATTAPLAASCVQQLGCCCCCCCCCGWCCCCC